jgi:hypothetical protein
MSFPLLVNVSSSVSSVVTYPGHSSNSLLNIEGFGSSVVMCSEQLGIVAESFVGASVCVTQGVTGSVDKFGNVPHAAHASPIHH